MELEGRHRRRTPDRQYLGLMREALKQKLDNGPTRISRDEVEEIGADIGLYDPSEAVRLFDRLKGISWRGEYVTSGQDGWTAARIIDAR